MLADILWLLFLVCLCVGSILLAVAGLCAIHIVQSCSLLAPVAVTAVTVLLM
jgi:hypothetical protein